MNLDLPAVHRGRSDRALGGPGQSQMDEQGLKADPQGWWTRQIVQSGLYLAGLKPVATDPQAKDTRGKAPAQPQQLPLSSDPETPVGARGIGEPPVGAGCCAILNALSDALGDEIYRRAPVGLDTILTSLEAGHPVQEALTAHI